MEDGGPDEGEHAAGEAADEPHQEGEVRDDHSEQDCHDHHADTEGQTVHLHISVNQSFAIILEVYFSAVLNGDWCGVMQGFFGGKVGEWNFRKLELWRIS